jgi:hypothetical protein
VIDILLAFPGLLLAIALVAVLGPSLTNVVMALTLIGWVGYARWCEDRCCARASSSSCRPRERSARPRRDPAAPRHSDDAAGGHRAGDAGMGARSSTRRP